MPFVKVKYDCVFYIDIRTHIRQSKWLPIFNYTILPLKATIAFDDNMRQTKALLHVVFPGQSQRKLLLPRYLVAIDPS